MAEAIAPRPKNGDTNEEENYSDLKKKPLSITITVESVKNIDECKVKEIVVKMEFAGETLCQSDRLKVKDRNSEVNLIGYIQTEDNYYKLVNDILSHPVLFTVYDCSTPVSPQPSSVAPDKDIKKKTTTKTTGSRSSAAVTISFQTVLGVCNLDIGHLLMERKRITEVLVVESDKTLAIKDSITWVKLPRLTATASISNEDILLNISDEYKNVMGITVESVYNPPEHITAGTFFDAIISIPTFGDKTNSMIFTNGTAKLMKDPLSKKKWSSLQNIEGRGGRSKHDICDSAYDVIHNLPPEVNLKNEMTKRGLQIEWNSWKRCLLTKADSNYIYSKLLKYHVWPIQILMANKSNTQAKSTKSEKKPKPGGQESSVSADHYTAFINFSSLLYPGVTKARAAAQLYTYSQTDLVNKFGVEFPPSNSQSSVLSKSKAASERSKTSAKEFEEKRDESPGQPLLNNEGLPVFIIVEMELWKPFTRQRPTENLEKQLKSYISLRGKMSKKMLNFETARKNFREAIQNVASLMVEEYHNFVQYNKNNKFEIKDLPMAFHQFLRCRESFNISVTCLKTKTLSFVHEKYGDLSHFDERIPEIYVAIVEEMHKATNDCGVEVDGYLKSTSSMSELQFFAEECLEENDYEQARKFYILNIAKNETHPDCWLDYAVFCLRMEEYDTALEAIREALSLDIYSQIGLLIYGLLMSKLRNGTVAELTLQFLVSKYPDFIEGWKAFNFLYTIFNNSEGADVTSKMCEYVQVNRKQEMPEGSKIEWESKNEVNEPIVKMSAESDKFHCQEYEPPDSYVLTGEGKHGMVTFVKGFSWTEPLSWTTSFCPPDNLNIRTTVLMLKLGLFEFGLMALAEDLVTNNSQTQPYYRYYLAVSHYLQGHYNEALFLLKEIVKEYGKDFSVRSLMGHCYYNLKDHANAIACYEYGMASYNRPDDIHLIYSRMGYYYLKANKFLCAKRIFTTGCKYSPSPRMWKGAGIACLRLNEYEEAETAFGEANYLDNQDPETWGYLAHTNGLLGRLDMLMHCYLEAKKRNLNNQDIIHEIECCMNKNRLQIPDE